MLIHIPPENVNEAVLEALKPAFELDVTEVVPELLVKEAFKGYVNFWRFVPEKPNSPAGIFMTRILDRKNGRHLFVSYLRGQDIISNAAEVVDKLLELAADLKCIAVEAEFSHQRLLEAAVSCGFKPCATRAVIEVDHG